MKLGIVGNGGIVKTALNVLKDTDIIVSSLWCRNAEKGKPLVEEYEEKFGPLKKSMTSTNMWSWIKGPWPWENEEDC